MEVSYNMLVGMHKSFTKFLVNGSMHIYMVVVLMVVAGASMVKWTKKVLRYTKTIIFLVKGLKVIAECYLKLGFFL